MSLRPRTLPAGFIEPCLPTSAKPPPSGKGWLHEIKHDGFRVIARKQDRDVARFARTQHIGPREQEISRDRTSWPSTSAISTITFGLMSCAPASVAPCSSTVMTNASPCGRSAPCLSSRQLGGDLDKLRRVRPSPMSLCRLRVFGLVDANRWEWQSGGRADVGRHGSMNPPAGDAHVTWGDHRHCAALVNVVTMAACPDLSAGAWLGRALADAPRLRQLSSPNAVSGSNSLGRLLKKSIHETLRV
jgi:hypothetical protein